MVSFGGGMAGFGVRHSSRSRASLFHTDMSSLSSGEHLTLGTGLSVDFVGDLVRLVSCVAGGNSLVPGSGVGTGGLLDVICVTAM